MPTRRELLQGMAWASAGVVHAAFPRVAGAQVGQPDITAQIRADLERHASFGDKFSGGAGDTANANWIAGRLRASGYRVRLVMLDTADPQRSLMVTDAARAAATEGFRGLVGLEQPVAIRPQAGELSTFTDRGYRTAFAVLGVHRWFHTVEDTIDRVDARLVVPVLRAHQRTIELLAVTA